MDYSLKVLDLCNLISLAVNRLADRRILLNFSLHLLNFSDQIEKLKKAKDILDRSINVNNTDEFPTEKRLRSKKLIEELVEIIGGMPRGTEGDRTVYAIGVLTVFVGSVLVTVLFGETDINIVKVRVPAEFVWADSVNGVLDGMFDRMKGKENVVLEVDDVMNEAVVVRDLLQVVINGGDGDDDGVRVRLEAGVKEMMIGVGVKRLSDGVDLLTNGVNGLFRTVLKIRNGCLDGAVLALNTSRKC